MTDKNYDAKWQELVSELAQASPAGDKPVNYQHNESQPKAGELDDERELVEAVLEEKLDDAEWDNLKGLV